ncbi:MAG: hypothetical protein HY332_05640, partial [Chloroflexi bacterium]|nr:hypothetical protein [Chloroflexota bacterium]
MADRRLDLCVGPVKARAACVNAPESVRARRAGRETRRHLGARTAAAVATAAVPAIVAACGGEKSVAPQTPRTISGPKVLSYTTWGDVSRPATQEMLQVFGERFGTVQVEAQ